MFDSFQHPGNGHWTHTKIGGGSVDMVSSGLRMGFTAAHQGHYTDAQIDDYSQLSRSRFPWRPPLRMQIEARSSHLAATTTDSDVRQTLRGTAGFGFWNYPFSVRGDILALPEAVWFFYASPPSNMALVPNLPGWGWKAQVVHSMRSAAFLAAAPLALSTSFALLTGESRPAARWMQRLTGAHEAVLAPNLTDWHTYTLEWQAQKATFWIDGQQVLCAPNPPTRPLGFVAWLDNQFAVATPRGVLRFGTIASGAQWFEITNLSIESL
jgi:hypothetical protein